MSSRAAKPAYRIDHVGSFLRPQELLDARARHQEGRLPLAELRALEDRVILDLLRMQEEVGLSVVSDGEVRREAWYSGFYDAVEGLEPVAGARTTAMTWYGVDGTEFRPQSGATALAAVRKLRRTGRIAEHEAQFLARSARGPYKITLPSPAVVAGFIFREGASNAAYTREEALADVTSIMRQELQALSDEGVPYIQLDEGFTRMVSEGWAEQVRAGGGDPNAEISNAIAAENACYAAVDRARVTLGMHLCRGNSRSRWVHRGGYDAIAERVFNELDVDRFLLEYDTERAGTFEPLRFVPKGKIVVLGLITTKVPELEAEDDVLRRIDEASRYLPLEQLALSPQCGFASVKEGNLVTADDQRRKLELVARIARKVWP